MPFICMLIIDFFANYLHTKSLLIGAVILLSVYAGYQGFERNYVSTAYYNNIYQEYKVVQSIVLNDATQQEISPNDITLLGEIPGMFMKALDSRL